MKADRIIRSAASALGAVTFALSLAVIKPGSAQTPNIVWLAGQPAQPGVHPRSAQYQLAGEERIPISPTALARNGQSYTLSSPPGSDFPSASGSVTVQVYGPLWGVRPWSGDRLKYYLCTVGAEISGLAPNTGYYFCLSGTRIENRLWFLTDENGKASLDYSTELGHPGQAPTAFSVVAYLTDVVELSSE